MVSIAAGFKGLLPAKVKSRPQCCDDDAMVICGCFARLNKVNPDMHDLLVDYYVFGMTFITLPQTQLLRWAYREASTKSRGSD
jgi:hypothetical protein